MPLQAELGEFHCANQIRDRPLNVLNLDPLDDVVPVSLVGEMLDPEAGQQQRRAQRSNLRRTFEDASPILPLHVACQVPTTRGGREQRPVIAAEVHGGQRYDRIAADTRSAKRDGLGPFGLFGFFSPLALGLLVFVLLADLVFFPIRLQPWKVGMGVFGGLSEDA